MQWRLTKLGQDQLIFYEKIYRSYWFYIRRSTYFLWTNLWFLRRRSTDLFLEDLLWKDTDLIREDLSKTSTYLLWEIFRSSMERCTNTQWKDLMIFLGYLSIFDEKIYRSPMKRSIDLLWEELCTYLLLEDLPILC